MLGLLGCVSDVLFYALLQFMNFGFDPDHALTNRVTVVAGAGFAAAVALFAGVAMPLQHRPIGRFMVVAGCTATIPRRADT